MYLCTTYVVVTVCMSMKCSLGFDNPRGNQYLCPPKNGEVFALSTFLFLFPRSVSACVAEAFCTINFTFISLFKVTTAHERLSSSY